MRNSSDIFCLNDDLTDGMQMFSVNGSRPMRISRRQTSNAGFEYCSSDTVEKSPESEVPTQSDEGTDPCSVREEYVDNASVFGDGDKPKESPPEPKKSFKKVSMKKCKDKTEPAAVSTSNMERNPLTGAGIEMEEHKKQKKQMSFKNRSLWGMS